MSTLIQAQTYIQLAHDVEGYRRLLRLLIAARRENVAPTTIPEWLARQPPTLGDPYTLRAMGWDAPTQSLVFEGRQAQAEDPESQHLYRVPLAPAP